MEFLSLLFLFFSFAYIYIYIYIYIFSQKFHDSCYVLEISLFQIFSYIIHGVGISLIYVEQISFWF